LLRVQQPDEVQEAREHPDRIGSAAEREQVDVVFILVIANEEFVCTEDIVIESITGRQAKHAFGVALNAAPGVALTDCTDAGVIIDGLSLASFDDPEQLQNICQVRVDLVTGSVAANDYVLWHRRIPYRGSSAE
jgi:hypothetical protein